MCQTRTVIASGRLEAPYTELPQHLCVQMASACQWAAGGLLLISQFTLAADATGGNRPSFTAAARPEDGRRLFDYFVAQARQLHALVQTGRFATEMQVHLVNDGPVMIPLRVV